MCDSVEDIEMSDVSKIVETPHSVPPYSRKSKTSDSMDSGYLSLTPQSFGSTPSTANRASTTKRHYSLRSDHWQDRRPRSRFNTLLNASAGLPDTSYDSLNTCSTPQDHSNESLRDQSGLECRYNFRKALRENRNKSRKNYRTLAVTPASIPILSPPPSPAIPSASFTACEPIDEDVEDRLVRPQSTPYSNVSTIPSIEITFSPRTSKTSPDVVTSIERHEFSKLKLTDFPSSEIKPKRLDFNQRYDEGCRSRIDVTGREFVDFLDLLGDKGNYPAIVGKILGFLRAEDLCAVSMVSRTWRRICGRDTMANMRRITHVCVRQSAKENFKLIRKMKESGIQESPKSRYTRGCLLSVQNLLPMPKRRTPYSPPVSPSKIKFHSFVKASRDLAPSDRLFSCPKCTFACNVNAEKNVGICTRKGCRSEFCTYCLSTPHTGLCKTPLLATPTKRKTPPLRVGSKQSKRNLRRL